MAKLTQFGRMRRRIKRELAAARTERALAVVQTSAMLASASAEIAAIRSTVVTAKMLAAWKREQAGEKLPCHPDGDISASQTIDARTGKIVVNVNGKRVSEF